MCTLVLPRENMINIAGAYSDDIGYIMGAYCLSLDPKTFSFGEVTQAPIPPEVKLLLAKDTWLPVGKTKDGIRQVDLVPYILEDGSITLVGEYRRTDIVTTGNGAKFYHLSGSLLYVRTGKKILIARIPKLRVSAGNRIGDSYRGVPLQRPAHYFLRRQQSQSQKRPQRCPCNIR
jgi:hypothetical protein